MQWHTATDDTSLRMTGTVIHGAEVTVQKAPPLPTMAMEEGGGLAIVLTVYSPRHTLICIGYRGEV